MNMVLPSLAFRPGLRRQRKVALSSGRAARQGRAALSSVTSAAPFVIIPGAVISQSIAAFLLMAFTVLINAIGLTLVMRRVNFEKAEGHADFWGPAWLLIRFTATVVTIHIVAIVVWGLFYTWQQCFPDFESSLYFSATTYTTVGYGDLVLPSGWRLFAGVEAITGILMCGLSTGFFFAVVSRVHAMQARSDTGAVDPSGRR
jgi:Ion channel